MQDPKNLVGNVKARFDKFEKMEVVNDHTLKIYAKEARFSNMDIICDQTFATDVRFYTGKDKDFNKSFNSKLFGSGPYLLDKVDRGKKVVLKRHKNYWGAHLPENIGRYNFDTFIYRALKDDSVRYEYFKKGKLDFITYNVAKRWKKETNSKKFTNNWIIAQRLDNDYPSGFSGVSLNIRRSPLDNLQVRRALGTHLQPRKIYQRLVP